MLVVTASLRCGENDWLLSIGPTHHVNYRASSADFFCNAESLGHLSTFETKSCDAFFVILSWSVLHIHFYVSLELGAV
jgi:hypothetical protein